MIGCQTSFANPQLVKMQMLAGWEMCAMWMFISGRYPWRVTEPAAEASTFPLQLPLVLEDRPEP